MTKRRAITDKMKWQAIWLRYGIPCWICGEHIKIGLQWDHLVELADDGPHAFDNLVPVHDACHRFKSAAKETDRSGIDRLERERSGLPKRKRLKRKIPSRPFPKKRPYPLRVV